MKVQKRWLRLVGLVVLMALVVAACGGAASSPDAATDKGGSEVMAQEESGDTMMKEDAGVAMMDASPDETMMGDHSDEAMTDASSDETMMDDHTGDAMTDPSTDDSMMKDDSETMIDLPDWFQAELTDVSTGDTFRIADYQGQVVLVETMAIWCSNCLRQQQEVKALHESLAGQEGWLTVVLDIDPNENADNLKAYTDKNGFNWVYAVAPRGVAREIGQLYGDQFLNPPSTPMLIIDQHGEVHPLPFGAKSAESLQEALAQFLSDGM